MKCIIPVYKGIFGEIWKSSVRSSSSFGYMNDIFFYDAFPLSDIPYTSIRNQNYTTTTLMYPYEDQDHFNILP